jgi:multidrug efflux pump subunit AcrB
MDQTEGVARAIESLIEEGLLGALLVAAMILLFLGSLKMTGIALLLLPLSALFTIIGLNTTGNTINAMTLGGLFLAIGPLVDNAIVVLENTQRHLGMGKNSVTAAIDAVGELILPLLVATLAMMVVLAPVAFTPGVAGFLYRPLGLAGVRLMPSEPSSGQYIMLLKDFSIGLRVSIWIYSIGLMHGNGSLFPW